MFYTFINEACCSQSDIDYIANNLEIRYEVLDNYENTTAGTYISEFTFINSGSLAIAAKGWQIYLTVVNLIEPHVIFPNGSELDSSSLKVFHVQGGLHRIEPMDGFTGLAPGFSFQIRFNSADYQVCFIIMFVITSKN